MQSCLSSVSSKLEAAFLLDKTFVIMAPKYAKRPIIAVEQGGTAGAVVDAVNGTIDSMPKTSVYFPVPPSI